MSLLLRLPFLVLLPLFPAISFARGAQPPSADEPLVDESLRQLIQDRNHAAAVSAIDKLLQKPSAHADYLLYLKGRALFFQQQYDAAVAQFGQLAKQSPKSPWARRARFATGVALAKKGDFRAAESIYRAEAESLLSTARKQELADVYLEYADAFFQPPKASTEPDYQAAGDFYRKALDAGQLPEKRREVELRVARCRENLKKTAEAAKLYAQFVHDHPDAPQAVEARYRLGVCLLQEKKLTEARRAWQDLLAAHQGSPSERVAEAAFQISRTWKLPQPQTTQQLRLGVAALDAFLQRFPTHKLAGQAYLDIARSYVQCERPADAAKRLTQLLADERLRDREEIPAARNLLGLCYRLQDKYAEAVAAWREYLAKHPADVQWSSVQQSVINAEYEIGLEKYRARDFAAARQSLSEFLARYPLDRRAAGILFLFGQMQAEQKQSDGAIADWRRTVSKHPGSNEASQAQFMIAVTLERELGKPEEALEEYRKLNWGGRAGEAQAAVSRLVIRSLTLATDRVFRSDETPTLRLATRNIESVTVRAYKLDLETYFRKMHSAANVENLDIALIDPDTTFEYKIPRFAKYRELESAVPVPLPGGG